MRHLPQIEDWIKNIESSDLKPKIKNQTINSLIDIWKFITFYDEKIILKSENVIEVEDTNGNREEINLKVKDLVLESSNVIQNILLETELELTKNDTSHKGKYTIQFQKQEKNLCPERISHLKEELLSVVQGKLVSFEHIEYIHKNSSDKIELYNSNLKIAECGKGKIQKALKQTTASNSPKKQWLILILDHLKNNCDAFFIQNQIKEVAFQSKFDKVFVFDFYKGQIVPIQVEN